MYQPTFDRAVIQRATLAWVIGGVRNPFVRLFEHAKMMAELQLTTAKLKQQALAAAGGGGEPGPAGP